MDAVSSEAQSAALFPAGVTEPEGLAGLGSDAWPLARLAASGGCDKVPADDVLSVGMDLRRDGRPENEIITDLETLASEAGARGLHNHVHGLTEMTLSVAAACAGVDFIGSDALSEGLDDWGPDDSIINPIDMFKSLLAAAKAGKGGG